MLLKLGLKPSLKPLCNRKLKKKDAKGQDSNDGLNFSDNPNGDVQFIEAPKVDQPRFMTPTRDTHTISIIPTFPSWLSNSISKKRNLQPISTPIKDIVTKYVARGSKDKKLKIGAHLTNDPVTGKIKDEVAMYKWKIESGEIDSEGFKVTSVELGTINRSTCNHFFKFSADHMLTQSKKDSRKKKELKGLVITMAAYIDSLMNLGDLPIVQAPQYIDPNSIDSQQ